LGCVVLLVRVHGNRQWPPEAPSSPATLIDVAAEATALSTPRHCQRHWLMEIVKCFKTSTL
jgi:hypothetical protein